MVVRNLHRPNLSRQIAEILRAEIIADFSPGRRIPVARELAKRFDVSFETVRGGLNLLAEDGLIECRPGRGIFVGNRIPAHWRKHVGVLCEWDISDPHVSYFYRRAPQQLVRFFRKAGAAVRLYAGHLPAGDYASHPLTCTEFLEAIERHQLSGAVAFAPDHTFPQWYEPLRAQHIPVVGPSQNCAYRVEHDTEALGRMGGEYLLRHGRRRIALMQWMIPALAGAPQRDPVNDGFQAALAAAGVPVNERWVRHDLPPGAPGAGWEELREIWVADKEKPDGLLVCDDMLFLGAAMAICQLGIRVPEDLLVATFSTKGSGLSSPFPVAKLALDLNDYVQTMGEVLLKLLRGEPVENPQVLVPCELLDAEEASDGSHEAAKSANEMEMASTVSESRSGDL